ncbi:hypothetical protein CKA32_002303 [Geitlerinema sp. FC II]|nr:hypothetical protein CKA32_002303 [Geitlerinema sp. FC II]
MKTRSYQFIETCKRELCFEIFSSGLAFNLDFVCTIADL